MESRKINLGCGDKKKEGYINIDKSKECNPDMVADVTNQPSPFDADSIERIEMDNLAEHIEPQKLIDLINECHRILISGGKLWIRVPELRPDNLMACFTDPTHINYFTDQTFGYYNRNDGKKRWKNFGKDYGIIGWSDVQQTKERVFLDVTLTK